MRQRLKTLKKLLSVYEAIEEMREAELARAAAEARVAEQAVGRERGISLAAALEERNALNRGDGMERTLAAARQQAAEWRGSRLKPVLAEREERSRAARGEHMESRQWSERMKRLVESAEATVTEEEDRHVQAASDERFLAQRRWKMSEQQASRR